MVYRATIPASAGLFLGCLSACSGNTAGQALTSMGLGPKTAQSQDFVVGSRPANIDYIPINPTDSGQTTPAKTAEQVKAAEQELDDIRNRNATAGAVAAKAGGTPPPDAALTPAKKRDSKPSTTTE